MQLRVAMHMSVTVESAQSHLSTYEHHRITTLRARESRLIRESQAVVRSHLVSFEEGVASAQDERRCVAHKLWLCDAYILSSPPTHPPPHRVKGSSDNDP